jgi:hypothetical protein
MNSKNISKILQLSQSTQFGLTHRINVFSSLEPYGTGLF